MPRETAASKNAKAQAYLDARVRHFTDTPGPYGRVRTPIQVRYAVLEEYINGGAWRLRDAGIEAERYYNLARKLPSAFSWEELRESTPNGRRSARNPQRFTITSGGRRVRVSGGNTFATRAGALDAARYLRSEDGGDYRVRPLKAGESTRAAVANGRVCSVPASGKCEACRERRATRVLPGAGAPHVCDGCYRVMIREDEHARGSSSNGRAKSAARGKKRAATGVRRSMSNPPVDLHANCADCGTARVGITKKGTLERHSVGARGSKCATGSGRRVTDAEIVAWLRQERRMATGAIASAESMLARKITGVTRTEWEQELAKWRERLRDLDAEIAKRV